MSPLPFGDSRGELMRRWHPFRFILGSRVGVPGREQGVFGEGDVHQVQGFFRDLKPHMRKLASFMGRPFNSDDEEEVEKVIWRSSFERLKELDVNI
ncbi:hypothetical protein LINPERPRIM_LOCUS5706 [Linum perenne]